MAGGKKHYGLSVSRIGNEILIFFKEKQGADRPVQILSSHDGSDFRLSSKTLFSKKFLGLKSRMKLDTEFKISHVIGQYVLSYCQENRKGGREMVLAVSHNGTDWERICSTNKIKECGAISVSKEKKQDFLLFFGKKSIQVATSSNFTDWSVKRPAFLRSREGYFDNGSISLDNVFETKEGNYLTYSARRKDKRWGFGAILFDRRDYRKILWRSSVSLWEKPHDWDDALVNFVGSVMGKGELLTYWEYDGELHVMPVSLARLPVRKKKLSGKAVVERRLKLKKEEQNPIIKPRPENEWESRETFNPAAVHLDGKIHLLYRALGEKGVSVLGYAASEDGVSIDERLDHPVYLPSQLFEYGGEKTGPAPRYPYMSGGSWSGCEDPRVSVIGDELYMTYVAFNGCHPPGVALTSIKIEDFLNKNWNWKMPKLISKPGEIQKNWVLFPEKIRGKFAVLHSISPRILIDYFDSLDYDRMTIESYHNNRADDNRWDNILRGVGAPPLKTNLGWLVLYHAMDRRDPNRYKVGAMILDEYNPEKVLYRCSHPILEPIEHYENEGSKAGVVYVCGSVIKDDNLFVYYGGADRFTCVATAPIKEFLETLVHSSKPAVLQKVALA